MYDLRRKFKPYTLVVVRKRDYSYIGEVMSYPIAETESIMVRRVPGHPGTLEKIQLNDLKLVEGPAPKWIHYAIVAGSGSFPVDMLRRDWASPLNFKIEDEYSRAVLLDEFVTIDGPDQPLVIAACDNKQKPSWTTERWQSFLWSVKPLSDEPLPSL